MQEMRVPSLGWEDPLEKEMVTHSSWFSTYLGNPTDKGAWQATVHGAAESNTTEQLTLFFFFLYPKDWLLQTDTKVKVKGTDLIGNQVCSSCYNVTAFPSAPPWSTWLVCPRASEQRVLPAISQNQVEK